jgi:hypothetical protein
MVQDYLKVKSELTRQPAGDPKAISTPLDTDGKVEPKGNGLFGPFAARFIGSALYLVRGTRPDAAHAVARLGRYVVKWDARCDLWLDRLMRYFFHTHKKGLIYTLNSQDRGVFHIEHYWDADHSGSPDSTRSTSGWFTLLMATNDKAQPWVTSTRALLDWGSRLQTATSKSTPEAEIIAGADSMTRTALPMWTLLEDLYSRTITFRGYTDNTTAEAAILAGFSKGLRHLRKHHRCSLGLLGEVFARPDAELLRVASEDNPADIGTKALAVVKFLQHLEFLGIASPGEFLSHP